MNYDPGICYHFIYIDFRVKLLLPPILLPPIWRIFS